MPVRVSGELSKCTAKKKKKWPPRTQQRAGDWQLKKLNEDMKTEHTPGPWQIFSQENDCGPFYFLMPLDTVLGPEIACIKAYNYQSFNEAEANAKLIAAAPELLETLIEVSDRIKEYHVGSVEQHYLTVIESAITKATNAH